MRPHVSAAALARFQQGDLSPGRTSRISTHLAHCARCRKLSDDLAGITTILASAHLPPMPEHLGARIQTALAAESARRVMQPAGDGTAPGPAVGAGTDGAPGPRHARPRRSGLLGGGILLGWLQRHLPRLGSTAALRTVAAAAAVVLVAGGIYEIVGHGAGPSPSSSLARGALRRPASSSPANLHFAPALPVSGPALPYRHAGHQQSVTPITTDTDFTPSTMRSQVAAEVSRYGSSMVTPGPYARSAPSRSTAPSEPATFGNIPVGLLDGCVNRMAAGELVLLVDIAYYQGAPATIIVTEVSAVSPEQVWVVGTGCSGSSSDLRAHAVMTSGG
jgi:hypothetical protein